MGIFSGLFGNSKEKYEQDNSYERQKNIMKHYLTYLNSQADDFKKQLQKQNCTPTWGFELISNDHNTAKRNTIKIEDVELSDVKITRGVAFDDKNKTFVSFSCKKQLLDKFINADPNIEDYFEFKVIPYDKIFAVKVEVNNQTELVSQSTNSGVTGDAIIGGIVAGPIGALVASNINNKSSAPTLKTDIEKVSMTIQTTLYDIPSISFDTKGFFGLCVDTMYSTFYHTPFYYTESQNQWRGYDRVGVALYISRNYFPNKNNNNEFILFSSNEDIYDRFLTYARRIETIIENNKRVGETVTPVSATGRLKELKELLDSELLTQEEYDVKRAEMLRKI